MKPNTRDLKLRLFSSCKIRDIMQLHHFVFFMQEINEKAIIGAGEFDVISNFHSIGDTYFGTERVY